MSGKIKIGRNIKFSTAEKVFGHALNLILLPFIIGYAGKELYGAYVLMMTFVGYFGLLDFGMGSAVVKYIAEFDAQNDEKKLAAVVGTSVFFNMLVGLLIGSILIAFSYFFEILFTVSSQNLSTVRGLFQAAAIASFLIWPGQTFKGVLRGLQRYDKLAIIGIIQKAGTGVAAYLVFTSGKGILSFTIWSYLFAILSNVLALIVVWRCLPRFNITSFRFTPEMFKKMFGFSFFIFLGGLTNIVTLHLDDIVVGSFISVSAVTLYSVAYTLQNGFRTINALLGDPLFPLTAEMEGTGEIDKQRELLLKGTKYITYIFIPLVLLVIVFAHPLIYFWIGSGFEESALTAQILVAFWIANSTLTVGAVILVAKGYARQLLTIGVLNASANLILSLILVRFYGIQGVALGTTLSMVLINFPLVLSKVLKVLNVSLREFFLKAVYSNLPIFVINIVLALLVSTLFYPVNLLTTLLEMGLIYTVILFGGLPYFFTPQERQELLVLVKG